MSKTQIRLAALNAWTIAHEPNNLGGTLDNYAPETVTAMRAALDAANLDHDRLRDGIKALIADERGFIHWTALRALLDGEAGHVEDCDCDACCTHEITEHGRCAGCGHETNTKPRETPPGRTGCQNRGWYHDGSEQADAATTGRTPRPCPHHGEAKG